MLADFWSVKSDFFLKWLKNVWLFLDHLYIDMKHYKVKAKFYLEFQATSTISSLPTPWIWNIDGIDFSVHQKPFEQGGTGRRGEEGFSRRISWRVETDADLFVVNRPEPAQFSGNGC